MDFLEFHSKRKIELEIPVMQNIFSLIHEIRHQLFSIKNIIIFKKVCLVPGSPFFFLLLIAPERVDSHCATHEVQPDIPGPLPRYNLCLIQLVVYQPI